MNYRDTFVNAFEVRRVHTCQTHLCECIRGEGEEGAGTQVCTRLA